MVWKPNRKRLFDFAAVLWLAEIFKQELVTLIHTLVTFKCGIVAKLGEVSNSFYSTITTLYTGDQN